MLLGFEDRSIIVPGESDEAVHCRTCPGALRVVKLAGEGAAREKSDALQVHNSSQFSMPQDKTALHVQ